MKEQSIFKNGSFLHLWSSQFLSQITINLLSFLVLVRLFEVTHSTLATSFLWIAYALPALIIGPIAPAVIDLSDKRKVLMTSNILQGLIIFSYALLYQKTIFLSYGAVFLYSFVNQFYVPAEAASLPRIVDKKNLVQANGIFFITQQSCLVVGFAIAGILGEVIGFQTTLLMASILLGVAFFNTHFLKPMKSSESIPLNPEEAISKFYNEIAEGFRFILRNREILFPFLLLMSLQVTITIIVVNLPILSTEILKIRPSASGIFAMAPAGIGAFIGILLVTKLLARGRGKSNITKEAMLGIALTMWCTVALIPLLPLMLKPLVAAFIFMFTGVSMVWALIPSQTYLQERTPANLLGRVFGNFWFITTIMTVFPVLFSATVTEVLGIKPLFLILGFIYFAGYLVLKNFGSRTLFTQKFYGNKI